MIFVSVERFNWYQGLRSLCPVGCCCYRSACRLDSHEWAHTSLLVQLVLLSRDDDNMCEFLLMLLILWLCQRTCYILIHACTFDASVQVLSLSHPFSWIGTDIFIFIIILVFSLLLCFINSENVRNLSGRLRSLDLFDAVFCRFTAKVMWAKFIGMITSKHVDWCCTNAISHTDF